MKRSALLVLAMLLLSGPAFAGVPIGGVWFVCSYDPEHERHFTGASGNDTLEPEAKKLANEECDRLGAGVATHVVYIYKNGTQKEDGK